MQKIIDLLFSAGNFSPHSEHFLPDHSLLMWCLIIGNIIIALLYFVMPFQLLYVYFKRKDFPFRFVFFAIPFFGFWCSATHLVMVISFWYPLYYLQAVVDAITGIVSFVTFLTFIPATYQALHLSSPGTLAAENAKLGLETEKHRHTKEKLAHKNIELKKVNEELKQKNDELLSLNRQMIEQELKMVNIKDKIRQITLKYDTQN